MTVLIYAWYSFSEYSAQARWFIVMNYLVHSVMYTYYALKSIKWVLLDSTEIDNRFSFHPQTEGNEHKNPSNNLLKARVRPLTEI